MSTSAPELEFSCVLSFLDGTLRREALNSALALGVVDRLLEEASVERSRLIADARLHARQAAVLFDLLVGHGVLEERDARLSLTAAFRRALAYRDLLETQLDYARRTALGVQRVLTGSLRDFEAALAELVGFFHYDTEPRPSDALVARMAPWVRYMSTLTRYQGPLLAARLGLGEHRQVLDVGGNNGELALAFCRTAPELRVRVVDLPAVCVLGRNNVAERGMSDRIEFHPVDIRRDALPGGADLVVCKSVLHDFSDEVALGMLDRVAAALSPGARIAIFEMHARDLTKAPLPEHEVVNFPFFTFLRPAGFYVSALEARGFADVSVEAFDAIHFSLITARRAGRQA